MKSAGALATGAEAPYWQALIDGHLQLQQCAGCGMWHWPAVWRCSTCGGWEQVWEDVPLTGQIYTWTRNWHAFGGLDALEKPFVIALVTLDGGGGARLLGIVDGDTTGVAIGDRVTGAAARTVYAGEAVPAIRWTRA